MNEQENYVQMMTQLVEELFGGINAGEFMDLKMIPNKYRYRHLCALSRLAYSFKDGITLYEKVYDLVQECGKISIQNKKQKGEKVKIAFLAISAAEWSAEEVYRLLENDERCESYIVVCPLIDRNKEAMERAYIQTYQFFEQSGHSIKKVYDERTESYFGWEELGGMPDIVIHLTAWYQALPKEFRIEEFPLTCLNCYIPYSCSPINSSDGTYARQFVYNTPLVNALWKLYTISELEMLGYKNYGLLHGKNVLCTGYPKMDYFYMQREYDEEKIKEIWKIPDNIDVTGIKKVIIAPHHSLRSNKKFVNFSTFPCNVYFWIYLAKKYKNEISFIFKPHPSLRARVVEAGLFESLDAYDAYIEAWNSLPNAKVVEEADYRDIFATSDGMIMDSCSFLAEYLYVDKPLLFLRKDGQAFDDLGEKLIPCYYQVQGEDYIGIEEFIKKTILGGIDELGPARKKVYEEELNYVKKNKCLASEGIYKDITTLLRKR